MEAAGRCVSPWICCSSTDGCKISVNPIPSCLAESLHSSPCRIGSGRVCGGGRGGLDSSIEDSAGRCGSRGICCTQGTCTYCSMEDMHYQINILPDKYITRQWRRVTIKNGGPTFFREHDYSEGIGLHGGQFFLARFARKILPPPIFKTVAPEQVPRF